MCNVKLHFFLQWSLIKTHFKREELKAFFMILAINETLKINKDKTIDSIVGLIQEDRFQILMIVGVFINLIRFI